MASIIPPRRPVRAGMPKLVLPTQAAPEDQDTSESVDVCQNETEATIMPKAPQRAPSDELEIHMDEIKRVLDQMSSSIPRGDEALELGGNQGMSREGTKGRHMHTQSTSLSNVQGRASPEKMRRSNSCERDCLVPGVPPVSELAGNLDVLTSLGEGASGEMAKARIRSTGKIVARKVCRHCDDCVVLTYTLHYRLLLRRQIQPFIDNCYVS